MTDTKKFRQGVARLVSKYLRHKGYQTKVGNSWVEAGVGATRVEIKLEEDDILVMCHTKTLWGGWANAMAKLAYSDPNLLSNIYQAMINHHDSYAEFVHNPNALDDNG